MRRRPSGSAAEEDEARPSCDTHALSRHGDKGADTPTNATREPSPAVETRERRVSHEPASRAASESPSTWSSSTHQPRLPAAEKDMVAMRLLTDEASNDSFVGPHRKWRARPRSLWSCSPLTLATTAIAALLLFIIIHSFQTMQLDAKGCAMSYMRAPIFVKFSDFDTEHTRFASKYSLYLHREPGVDEDPRVKGIPVIFIPGNAGSYKQVRSFASEAANHFHDVLRHDVNAIQNGKRPLDFFTVDFNEDITAFHGQTLLDQAEYLNEAVAYILSLYHNPQRSVRDPQLPDPTSVIILGHSMGGIVARTMLVMPNYQANSINTIITLSAPHARPPVSFDADIVNTYSQVNEYWRRAYSQKWANNNPLWHVTLISIAGGGLDTVVPSDYANLASLVPETHGFTVFTSTIPRVWTGMDHLEITFCNQLRKVLIRALYDVVDVSRPAQTRPRAERMRSFKQWLLTGMEDFAERGLPHKDPRTLLTLEDNSNDIISQGERLILGQLGHAKKPQAHLLPVPPQGALEGRKFTLLTDQKLDAIGEHGKLEVLFCSVFPLQAGHSASIFSMDMDLSGHSAGSTRLACKNAALDAISLPASTKDSKFPFESTRSFTYLQYDLEDLGDQHFVAVVDKATENTPGWVVAEFSASSESVVRVDVGLSRLITSGLQLNLPATRPMVTEIKIPALHSSLLSYKLNLDKQTCVQPTELFAPLVRQYISEPYESKYFVNVREASINLHGIAPYMPPPMRGVGATNGLSLQLWTDPGCNSSMSVTIKVDVLGSMGKLYMRYRTVFAAFPLLVVALVLRKQFKVYDETGTFISFAESLDLCLRSSLPTLFLGLTFFGMSLASPSKQAVREASPSLLTWQGNATENIADYSKNDLLLGSTDPFFWFLVPLFALIAIGTCIAVNYLSLALVHFLALLYGRMRSIPFRTDDGRRTPANFAITSTRQRIITTSILLLMVSTCIPYHFAYVVLCIVQLATSTRALRLARDTRSAPNYNFYNYTHSIFVLMLWVLPINLMVLIVWVRNLALHWFTPFSSHHNILSIMPYILLVETLSTGRMIPRVTTRFRYITSILLFIVAVYAGIYGVTYAYLLHHLINILSVWLVAIHWSTSSFSLSGLNQLLEEVEPDGHLKKRP